VGFSYSDSPSDYITNDEQTARDSYTFLLSFFVKFPQFKNNQFFIAGESFAGTMISLLTNRSLRSSIGAKSVGRK
jgi:carboxypeptidase C (cathepsin A)